MEKIKKNYVCSDLHGRYDLWTAIKNYLQDDDTLVCLGDVIDRGPDGIKILMEMLKNDKIVFLKGNHEEMMLNALKKQETGENFLFSDTALWYENGRQTYL